MFEKNNLDGLSFEQAYIEEFVAEEPNKEFEEVVTEECIEPDVSESCYIIRGNLNLRKEASVKSDVIKVLPLGLVLDVKEKAEDWTRVSDGSDEGWVMTEFLQFEE